MISVLLPVRNGSQTLEIALQSLFQQTIRDSLELVVVNDGSTDSTAEVLSLWKKRWPSIRVITTPGLGVAKAANTGLAFCSREWIGRMDADDRSHPERFEKQLALGLSDPKISLIGSQVRHWPLTRDSDAVNDFGGMARHIEWANSKTTHEEMALAIWIDSPLTNPSLLARHDVFEKIGAYSEDPSVPEDYEWLMRFFLDADSLGFKAAKVPGAPLLDWADHFSRLTRTNPAYSEEAFNRVKAEIFNRLTKNEREVYVFGLGPKAKAFFPMLLDSGVTVSAFVDVNPRRKGEPYRGVPVLTVDEWKARNQASANSFVLNVVGTPEARASCEKLCLEEGLKPFASFLSV